MSSPWSWQQGPPPFLASAPLPEDVKSRTWNRALWGGELAFAIGTLVNPGFSDMLLCCHLSLSSVSSTKLTIDHVRRATRALRWSHPGIATTIAFPSFTSMADFKPDQGRLLYQAASGEEEVGDWLNEGVFDDSAYLKSAGGDLDGALDALKKDIGAITAPRNKWMLKVHFIGDSELGKYGILIQTGHTIFDGIGTFEVLDLWLHELAQVLPQKKDSGCQWGEEAVRLAKAVPDRSAAPWSAEPTPPEHPILKEIGESLKMAPVQFGLPVLHPDASPTYTGTILKTFPAPLAENLRLTARAHGCGVFSVIVAANYLSLLSLNPPASYTGELHARILPNASDLRAKYLTGGPDAKKDRRTWQVSSALGGGVVSSRHLERFLASDDLVNDVWTLARELQEQVNAQAPYQATAAQWVPDAIAMMMASFFAAPAELVPKNKVVNVSSMGLMDDSLSPTYPTTSPSSEAVISISRPVFTGIGPGLPPNELGAVVHPYTWNGELFLSFSFPAAYMGSAEEQKKLAEKGEPVLYAYIERFGELLRRLANPQGLPN
ncbi:hypothetical protein DACRYDRAFT_17233 [Dacryopinax primogenitus]|uniref:CoA-dependent acyltransferase n=1 Tax=Dacryopinax primogenitus (strain DJM 731) TaxID=1858805 RepID=M5FVA1_DACPD|nr:uncharacterized protein DACRYDRAFT_17233 [Dacryopinax primogenitus]EJT99544.1 hypothetical protein DACRYDRAFT_17233 [Dacryopinax primogenitus]